MNFTIDRDTYNDVMSGKLFRFEIAYFDNVDDFLDANEKGIKLVYLDEFKYYSHYMLFMCNDRVLLFQVSTVDNVNYELMEILERSPLYDYLMEFYYR